MGCIQQPIYEWGTEYFCMRWADFHPPPVVAAAMIALRQLAGVAAFPFGGYEQAERTRIFLGQEDIIEALKADPQQVSCKAQVLCRRLGCFVPVVASKIL